MRNLIVAMILTAALPAAADELAVRERPSVEVQGEAEIQVEPDHATLRLGVEHFDDALLGARGRNQAALETLFARVQALGVARADIASTPTMVFPARWSCGSCSDDEKRTGHTARASVTITLRKLSTLMDLVNTLSDDAAVQLEDVEYRTSALRQHRDQARALAVRAAQEKAAALSGELKQQIGKALSISEQNPGGDGYWSWSQWGYSCCGYYSYRGSSGSRDMMQNVVMQAAAAPGAGPGGDGPLAPGRIAVRARVSVLFELL
jgi:uncharacterized protein YggE